MPSKKMRAVYLAGLLQGVVLVAFPATSTLLTSSQGFNLSPSQYGALFLPQTLFSIAASFASAPFASKIGIKGVFTLGLFANLLAMLLFLLSAPFMNDTTLVYPLLLLSTSFVGLGFGLTTPTINTAAELLNPNRVDKVVLILNALLGVGTFLAPVFITLFISFGIFWGLPLALVLLLTFLLFLSIPLHFPEEKQAPIVPFEPPSNRGLLFLVFAFVYGSVETLNGNWTAIYMKEVQQTTHAIQSSALTIFWMMVTLGRVFFAACERIFSSNTVYRALPLAIFVAFLSLGFLPSKHPFFALSFIALAGFGCSALLPYTISLGGKASGKNSRSHAANTIALYLLGYGVGAFGPGLLLEHTPTNLSNIYLGSTLATLILLFLSYKATKKAT